MVTVNDKGTATITVRTLDGSNLEASCMIQGVPNIITGIMDAESDRMPVDIYSAKGILLRQSPLRVVEDFTGRCRGRLKSSTFLSACRGDYDLI